MRFKLAVAGVAALALAVAAPFALGQAHFDSKVTITKAKDPANPAQSNVWQGKVKSEKGKCKGHRKVTVFEHLLGAGQSDGKLGTTHTRRNGKWKFSLLYNGSPNEDYYAKVGRKQVKGGVCKPDRSKSVLAVVTP